MTHLKEQNAVFSRSPGVCLGSLVTLAACGLLCSCDDSTEHKHTRTTRQAPASEESWPELPWLQAEPPVAEPAADKLAPTAAAPKAPEACNEISTTASVDASFLTDQQSNVYDAARVLQIQINKHPIVVRLRHADGSKPDACGRTKATVLKSYKGPLPEGAAVAYKALPPRYIGQTYTEDAYVMADSTRQLADGSRALQNCVVVAFSVPRSMVPGFMRLALVWSGLTTDEAEDALERK